MKFSNSSSETRAILKSLKADPDFNEKFDGTIRNGKIEGYYRTVTRKHISYLKILGEYNLDVGTITIQRKPSNVFTLVLSAAVLIYTFCLYGFLSGSLDKTKFIILMSMGLIFGIGNTAYYFLEKQRFDKHFKRIYFRTQDPLE